LIKEELPWETRELTGNNVLHENLLQAVQCKCKWEGFFQQKIGTEIF
jgi:hypothetical protein